MGCFTLERRTAVPAAPCVTGISSHNTRPDSPDYARLMGLRKTDAFPTAKKIPTEVACRTVSAWGPCKFSTAPILR
jgi:hypothetical protein